jgi:hypothetical protein
MTSREPYAAGIADVLLRHAAWIAPPPRKEWVRAMRNELEHLPRRSAAVSWALGCVLASYRERGLVMIGSLTHVSRWLLSIEMAVCLVPLTWLFMAVVTATAHGFMPLQLGILAGSATLLGPVGLAFGARIILTPAGSAGRTMTTLMAFLTAWTVIAYSLQVLHGGAAVSEWWREFVLIAILPTWAVAHLLQINAARRALAAMA